jgi:hypothetical protein
MVPVVTAALYYINSMELSPSWEAARRSATQEISQHFMAPEASLPCSQEPSNDPYPKPDQSSPYHSILSLPATSRNYI